MAKITSLNCHKKGEQLSQYEAGSRGASARWAAASAHKYVPFPTSARSMQEGRVFCSFERQTQPVLGPTTDGVLDKRNAPYSLHRESGLCPGGGGSHIARDDFTTLPFRRFNPFAGHGCVETLRWSIHPGSVSILSSTSATSPA